MSFVQGLLAGTQAARNVMDSYKEARDARIQREFAQGLTELDEQQKLNQAGLQSYYSGANTERFAEAPTQAPTRFGQGLMPEAVPQAPLTPEQMVQQQLALANRLGLRQEAGNFTNQLNAMRQQQMEEQRYNQQGLFNEQKFEADEAFRAEQLRLAEIQRQATANLQGAQAQALASQESRAIAEQESKDDNTFGEAQALALLNTGNVDFSQLSERGPAATNAFYKGLEARGIDLRELGQLSQNFANQLDGLYSTNYSGNEATQLRAVTNLAQRLDPNAANNVPVKFVKQKDGSYVAEEGGVVLAQGSLDDIVTQFKEQLDSNPMGFGVSLYSINKKQLEANARQIQAAIKDAELSLDKSKLVMDGVKAIMGRTMPPTVGSPEFNQEVYGLFEVAGVPLEKVPQQFWPENAQQILDAQAKARGEGDEVVVVDQLPTYKTADERVAAILKEQNTNKAGLNTQSGTPAERLAAINEVKRIEELNRVLPAQERKASAAKYSQELDSGTITVDDLLLLKSEGGLGALEEEAITIAIAGYRNRKAREIAEASARTGRYSPPIVK